MKISCNWIDFKLILQWIWGWIGSYFRSCLFTCNAPYFIPWVSTEWKSVFTKGDYWIFREPKLIKTMFFSAITKTFICPHYKVCWLPPSKGRSSKTRSYLQATSCSYCNVSKINCFISNTFHSVLLSDREETRSWCDTHGKALISLQDTFSKNLIIIRDCKYVKHSLVLYYLTILQRMFGTKT